MFCSIEGLSCKNCIPRNTAKEEIKRAKQERERRGCEKPSNQPQYGDSDTGEVFYRCPISQVEKWAWFMIDLFNNYESGFLPCDGSIMEQPAKVMNVFKVIQREKADYLKEKNKG